MDGGGVPALVFGAMRTLNTQRSSIRSPWDAELSENVPWQIPAPTLIPLPHVAAASTPNLGEHSEVVSARSAAFVRKRKDTPWLVAEEESRQKALDKWRLIMFDSLASTGLGRSLLDAEEHEGPVGMVERILADTFRGKATGTLNSRSSSMLQFMRWRASNCLSQQPL